MKFFIHRSQVMLRAIPIALSLHVLVATVGHADDEPKGSTDPKGVPLELKVVVKKASYALNLGGKTPEEFTELVKKGTRLPVPEVDLVLELRNTGEKELKVWVGGGKNMFVLDLKGPGAQKLNREMPVFRNDIAPVAVSLAPGKSHQVSVKSLSTGGYYSGKDKISSSYWTKPGEYTLTISFQTFISPWPEGAQPAAQRFGNFGCVTVTSAPVKLTVVEPK
jgi:hypothetical protein